MKSSMSSTKTTSVNRQMNFSKRPGFIPDFFTRRVYTFFLFAGPSVMPPHSVTGAGFSASYRYRGERHSMKNGMTKYPFDCPIAK
jgi:hypothetical protein